MAEELEGLGPNLAAVAEETSLEVALRLAEHLGGRHIEVPRRPAPGSPIVKAVGQEAAQAICRRFVGSRLYVPIWPGKRAQIRILRERAGWTIPAIASYLRCTERFVYKVLAEGDDRQLDLI